MLKNNSTESLFLAHDICSRRLGSRESSAPCSHLRSNADIPVLPVCQLASHMHIFDALSQKCYRSLLPIIHHLELHRQSCLVAELGYKEDIWWVVWSLPGFVDYFASMYLLTFNSWLELLIKSNSHNPIRVLLHWITGITMITHLPILIKISGSHFIYIVLVNS